MKINFLETIREEKTDRQKKPRFLKSVLILVVAIPLFFTQTTLLPANWNPFIKIGSVLESFEFENITEWVSQIGRLIRSNDKLLAGETENRINFLLLGMGGAGHEGAYLTDTIILVSFKPKEKKIAMISIPRDLIVPVPGYGWRKINNVNAFAEAKERGSGGEAVQTIVSQVFDIPIHYYVRIDFEGFKKLIDRLGGLSIYVDRSFTDYQYPTNDFKYQVVSFRKGWQVMDGETVLKFVRSRHGTNGEASDFARSQRQQKVLVALKEKILSYGTLLNPLKLQSVYETVKDSVNTNLEMWEIVRLRKLADDIDTENIIHQVINADPGGLLVAANVDGAYILKPRSGNFDELQFLAKNIFNLESQIIFEEKPKPVRVEIQNGTKKNGLAARTAEIVKKMGFEVTKIGNAKEQNYERTIIYDLTQGQKNDKLNLLREKFDADISLSVPSWMTSSVTPTEITLFTPPALTEQKSQIDFLIILGKNASY